MFSRCSTFFGLFRSFQIVICSFRFFVSVVWVVQVAQAEQIDRFCFFWLLTLFQADSFFRKLSKVIFEVHQVVVVKLEFDVDKFA